MLKLTATLAAVGTPSTPLTFDFEGDVTGEVVITLFRDWVNKVQGSGSTDSTIADRLLADAVKISAGADQIAAITATLVDVG